MCRAPVKPTNGWEIRRELDADETRRRPMYLSSYDWLEIDGARVSCWLRSELRCARTTLALFLKPRTVSQINISSLSLDAIYSDVPPSRLGAFIPGAEYVALG